MEKLVFGEELRALFREIFKIEVKDLAKDVAFFGKLSGSKLNEERLSLMERNWLQNIGVLTRDSKNLKDIDNRSIFSHIFSAVYAGLYGLNFVDVTSHCLETIKEKKGLKPNQNLVDFLSPQEIRQFSIALNTLSNELKQLKKSGTIKSATISNFYFVADKAFNAGLNARRGAVMNENSEFETREATARHSAKNTLNNIEAALSYGTFSHKRVQFCDCDKDYLKKQKDFYLQTEQQLKNLLELNNFTSLETTKIISLIDEGYYKSKYFRTHANSISNLIKRNDSVMSTRDIESQNLKLLYAKINIEKYLKRTTESSRQLSDVLNIAFRSGKDARFDCMCKNKTSPEYFSSFMSAMILDKENQLNQNS